MRFTHFAVFATLLAVPVAVGQTGQTGQPVPPVSGSMPSGPVSPSDTSASGLKGMVTDPDGAVIPGATVTLTPARGKAIVRQSGQDGSYAVTGVAPGTYSVTVTMPGFSSAVKQGVKFGANQTVTFNVKLAVEEQNTEVTVNTNANAVSVDQDSNASSLVIKDKDLDALSDDPDELSSELTALAGPSAGPSGGQIYVDGFTGGQLPPKSSIREIRINQNPFSAQYDKPGFGRVEILTKPGSDAYHGQGFIMGNYSPFNTSSPFLGNVNQFPSYFTVFSMGSLSGPLTKNSSFSVNGSYRNVSDNGIISAQIYSTSATSPTLCAPGASGCAWYAYPSAYRAVNKPSNRWDISPRLDFGLTEKNTLTVRYRHEQGSNSNSGIGTLALPSRGTNAFSNEDEITLSDSQVFSSRVVNETRAQYRRDHSSTTSISTDPSVSVSGVFSGGGTSSNASVHTGHFELQNYASVALAKHFIRFGGRLRWDRSASWSNSGANGSFTYSQFSVAQASADTTVQSNCTLDSSTATYNCTALNAYAISRPTQYSITAVNDARVNGGTTDVGLYAEDDWKVKPNLTLSGGIRYETQNVIHSNRDFAPRVSVAWGVPRKSGQPTTVVRAGFGIFYDRFDLDNILTTYQQNGTRQVSTVYTLDTSTASTCAPSNTSGCAAGSSISPRPTIYSMGNLRSEYNMQFAVGVDQQIGKATASFNWVSANGVHAFLSRSLTTATSSTINYQFQSAGVYHQNELMFNGRYNPSRNISIFGYYVYTIANANTTGGTGFVMNAFNPRADYGRATFATAQRFVAVGSFTLPYGLSANPILFATSGSPYSVTTGTDDNGDTQFNDRAYFLPGRNSANCSNVNDFATASESHAALTPVGYCTGPTNFRMDLRLAKSFGFGKKAGAANIASSSGGPGNGPPSGGGGSHGGGSRGGGMGGGGRGGPGGGGGPMFGGGGSSNNKYNFTIGAQAFNLFNVVPYATPVSTLSNSSQFGKSLALSSGGFGGTASAVRRIMLQASFNF